MNMGKFNYISLEEARTRAMEEKYIVADLRSTQEFYYSHVDNAINVPNPTVEKIAQYNKKDYTWILYCRRGSLSFKLASELSDFGYKVLAVVGGYKE